MKNKDKLNRAYAVEGEGVGYCHPRFTVLAVDIRNAVSKALQRFKREYKHQVRVTSVIELPRLVE